MKKNILLLILLFSALLSAQSTRFMVVSDMHHSSPAPDLQKTLLFEIVQAAMDEKVDFIFFTGDLVISGFSSSAEQDSALKDWRFILETLSIQNIQVYACRGNNDVNREAWDALFSGAYAFPQNGPENERNITYAVGLNDILFISLDQYIETHRINQDWLDEVLAANTRPFIFVAAHEPAFKLLHTNCMDACPRERDVFWESLFQAGVKIFFCGHDHFYDHSIIDDGDGNMNNDVHQVIVGTGGSLHSDSNYNGDNGRWTPARLYHEEENGYALVEVDESNIRLTWKHRMDQNVFENGGDICNFAVSAIDKKTHPEKYGVLQNYPNPFNGATTVHYHLPYNAKVELCVYNSGGEQVAVLVSEKKAAGRYSIKWDGSGYASGVYICRLIVQSTENRFVETAKLLLLK